MRNTMRRLAIVCGAIFAACAFVTVAAPGVSGAAECGAGTVFDPPSNSCVAAPAPPPPPPPPVWNGDPTPYFSVGVCVPIPVPFAPSVCASV
ncbi:hypothetical protein [Mycobacterium sp. 1274761.0]|uniref:hypothetical protein n=1 Tax=Mycobacterium sp. 1274761.0 TaxID=1834077 RepID=UPI0008016A12|nr:hypothetical protein [Mycobacterium sp. 1274761.0]OBK71978.1 hypothetical protein A5651_17525 [Mycobacterium sp. 1274761.0]